MSDTNCCYCNTDWTECHCDWMEIHAVRPFGDMFHAKSEGELTKYKDYTFYCCWGGGPEGGFIASDNDTAIYRVNRNWLSYWTVEKLESTLEINGGLLRLIKPVKIRRIRAKFTNLPLHKVNRYTRAGKDGRPIFCPHCRHESVVYHFSWCAITCQACRGVINKADCLVRG